MLFTDIVGSTDHAVRLGDRGWRDLQERHYALVRRELARHRGREIDTAGDGFLVTFDGPARALRAAAAIRTALAAARIPLRGEVIGGSHGRSVHLYTADGRLSITSVRHGNVEL